MNGLATRSCYFLHDSQELIENVGHLVLLADASMKFGEGLQFSEPGGYGLACEGRKLLKQCEFILA